MSWSTATVANLTLTNADTEYSYEFSSYVKSFLFKTRSSTASIKLSFIEGGSGTIYFTIPAGSSYELTPAVLEKAGLLTMYVQSPTAGTVLEIIEFS